MYEVCSNCLSCDFVVCGARMAVMQLPSSCAAAVLKSTAVDVTGKVMEALELVAPVKLPFWWWWGPSLDEASANRFQV
jgi:hypothetical protein